MKTTLLSIALIALGAPLLAQDPLAGGETFRVFCATCHGEDARGAGPMTDVMTVVPPDLTLLTERAGGVFPAFEVAQQIDGRDPMLSHGGSMPIFGNFFDDGSQVALQMPSGQPMLTTQPIADLLVYLEGLQR